MRKFIIPFQTLPLKQPLFVEPAYEDLATDKAKKKQQFMQGSVCSKETIF